MLLIMFPRGLSTACLACRVWLIKICLFMFIMLQRFRLMSFSFQSFSSSKWRTQANEESTIEVGWLTNEMNEKSFSVLLFGVWRLYLVYDCVNYSKMNIKSQCCDNILWGEGKFFWEGLVVVFVSRLIFRNVKHVKLSLSCADFHH